MSDPIIVQALAAGFVIAVLSVVFALGVILAGSGCIVIAARIAAAIDRFRTRHAA